MSTPVAIPTTQRAAIITSFNQPYTLSTTHPVPSLATLAPNQCLVKILVSGCCHSDLHIRQGEWARATTIPIVGGHEGVGKVVAIGEHTQNTSVKIGDRVGCKWIARTCLQ